MTQATHRQRGNVAVYRLDSRTHTKLHSVLQDYLEDVEDLEM